MFETYYKRFGFLEPQIKSKPKADLGLVVVIPAFNEISLIPSIESLLKADKPNCSLEIIVVFNASDIETEEVKQKNIEAKKNLESWFELNSKNKIDLYCFLHNDLPKKHAGVGLARKIGMDEAVSRFSSIDKLNGVIVCFDADSLCQKNYFKEIEAFFSENIETSACSIHFEHPLEGEEHCQEIYDGICFYELHLRYYKQGLAYANLPFAYHSVGSSMAVRALNYMKQGGMNRRKAGEDFYFLQKFIDIDSFGEISSTMVIPSPRMSDRVPFGTGRAIKEMMENEREIEKSYAFEVFEILKESFANVKTWYNLNSTFNPKMIQFIGEKEFSEKIHEIKSNSTNKEGFEKRFFQWFNAFKVLKFVHFLRDNYYPNMPLIIVVPQLLKSIGSEVEISKSKDLLLKLRKLDKAN